MIRMVKIGTLIGALIFVAVAALDHDPELDLKAGWNAFRAGDMDSALRLGRLAALVSGRDSREWGRAMELQARAALGLKRADWAGEVLDLLLKTHPDQAGGLQLRGELRLKAGDSAGALEDLNRSQKSSGQDQTKPTKAQAPYLAQRGQAFIKAGNLEAAQKDAEAAYRLNPRHPEVLYVMSLVLESKGQIKPALDFMEEAIRAANRADRNFLFSDKEKEWVGRIIDLRAKLKLPLVKPLKK